MIRSKLSIETLETRQMLAGDGCYPIDPPAEIGVAEIEAGGPWVAADAGGTLGTAPDLGRVEGTHWLAGSLGWFDTVDMFRFSIERDAELTVALTGLRRNADLYLIDGAGNLVAASMASGSRAERISTSLDAGTYSIAVVARSIASNWYQLSVAALLESPPLIVPPELPAIPETPTNAIEDSPKPLTPLPEVADFGGSRDWGLNSIGAPEAWAAGYAGRGVTVAVVDSGVNLDHPDLVHSLYVNPGEIAGNGIDDDRNGYVDDVQGYDFVDGDVVADDGNGHGTHVAGIIAAANNGFGATGVAPDATIIPVRVLDNHGAGWSSDVAAGIRYAAELGADIINLSLGGGYSSAIDQAIDYARSLGSLIVAAAGNEAAAVPGYPARLSATDSNVISVGAYASNETIARFSNHVGSSRAVQIDAPGVGIYSTYSNGRYATLSGTSMAAPHVSGLAALARSSNPNLTYADLRQLLTSGVVGSVRDSDSIGRAAAQTTVAYAAAGSLSAQSSVGTDAPKAALVPPAVRARTMIDSVLSNAGFRRDVGLPSALLPHAIEALKSPATNVTKTDRIADFAVPSESCNSPVDRYFEALFLRDQGQFDTPLTDQWEEFA